jgi:hypothetical protein
MLPGPQRGHAAIRPRQVAAPMREPKVAYVMRAALRTGHNVIYRCELGPDSDSFEVHRLATNPAMVSVALSQLLALGFATPGAESGRFMRTTPPR